MAVAWAPVSEAWDLATCSGILLASSPAPRRVQKAQQSNAKRSDKLKPEAEGPHLQRLANLRPPSRAPIEAAQEWGLARKSRVESSSRSRCRSAKLISLCSPV